MPRWLLDEHAARARQTGARATTLDGSTPLLPSQPAAPAVESIADSRPSADTVPASAPGSAERP
ncbi:hypothetical protein, partial [Cellulomonas septica]|uniref:hypothetical protein n=1 Tax=Cellulomonas septica TaxID=285080 RepID=UPI001B348D99